MSKSQAFAHAFARMSVHASVQVLKISLNQECLTSVFVKASCTQMSVIRDQQDLKKKEIIDVKLIIDV